MNETIVDSFKNACSGRLKQLIDRCYLSVQSSPETSNRFNSGLICGIYTPLEIKPELRAYRQKLENIGEQLEINWVYLIPVDNTDLARLRDIALVRDSLEARKFYLELQLILSVS